MYTNSRKLGETLVSLRCNFNDSGVSVFVPDPFLWEHVHKQFFRLLQS